MNLLREVLCRSLWMTDSSRLSGALKRRFNIDFVNLRCVEEALGEAQVDARAQEQLEQLTVKVPHAHVVGQQADRLRKPFARLVGAIGSGERLKDVGNGHDARLHGH